MAPLAQVRSLEAMTTPEPFPGNPNDNNPNDGTQYGANPYDRAPAQTSGSKKLHRSSSDKMIAGVCGGLADYFGVDSTWVRVAFAVSILLPGPQILLYLLLWLIIPKD